MQSDSSGKSELDNYSSNLDYINDDDSNFFKVGIMTIFIMELGLALFIIQGQYSHVKVVKNVPKILESVGDGVYTWMDFQFSRKYNLDKLIHQMGEKIYTVLLWITIIFFDCIPLVWDKTVDLNFIWPEFMDPKIGRNMSFAMISYIISELLMLPVNYCLVLIKVKHGMYNQDGFLNRYFKRIVVNLVPLILAAGFLTWVLMYFDTKSIQIQTMILCPLAILFVILYPTLEVWNSLSQLENRTSRYDSSTQDRTSFDLKQRLTNLCNRVGFPRKQVLVHSSGSPETSAFYYGFLGYRRIVVFQGNYPDTEVSDDDEDNPIESDALSPAETEAIVAHELGHWRYTHSDISLLIWHAMQISTMFLVYWLRSNKTILQIFNFQREDIFTDSGITCLPGAFIVYFIVLRLYYFSFETVLQFFSNVNEAQADAYSAVQLGYGKTFGKGLTKLIMAQKTTFPSGRPLYQLCYHNHPALVQRLALLKYKFKSLNPLQQPLK